MAVASAAPHPRWDDDPVTPVGSERAATGRLAHVHAPGALPGRAGSRLPNAGLQTQLPVVLDVQVPFDQQLPGSENISHDW